MKSTNISSATGRRPEQAAPTAAPMNADSLIGVSRIRSGYLAYSPLVTPSTPPQASISPAAPFPPTVPPDVVLAEHHHRGVAAHLLIEGFVARLHVGDGSCHRRSPLSVLDVDVG